MHHPPPAVKPQLEVGISPLTNWLISSSQENLDDVQWPVATHQPHQLHLPAEILIKIFHYSCANEYPSLWTEFRDNEFDLLLEPGAKDFYGPLTALSLMLTCRRFRDLAEPILYSQIFVIRNAVQGVRSYRNLLYTLNLRPNLCQYVQHFQLIETENEPMGEVEDILDILHRINPTKVALQGCEHRIDPRICRALTKFEIRTLHASQGWCQFAFEYLQSPKGSSLRHLSLRSCFQMYDSEDEPLRRIPTKQTLPDHEKCFNIKTLEIISGDFVLNGLEYFCQLIPALTVFVLRAMLDRYARRCMRKLTQTFINRHQRTLEVIHLPVAICKCRKMPDIGKCISLKHLSMYWDNLSCEDAETAMGRIESAPLLEHISIYMTLDVAYNSGNYFDDTRSCWLTKFASSRKAYSQLKYIHVILDDQTITDDDQMEDWGDEIDYLIHSWPYHHLYLLRPVLQELGIRLSWSQPRWSRAQWNERMYNAKKIQKRLQIKAELEEQDHGASWIEHEVDILVRSELPNTLPAKDSTQKRIDDYFVPLAPGE